MRRFGGPESTVTRRRAPGSTTAVSAGDCAGTQRGTISKTAERRGWRGMMTSLRGAMSKVGTQGQGSVKKPI